MRNLLVVSLLALAFQVNSQVFDAIIAADGSGTYTTIKGAIDRVRPKSSGRYLFYIMPGKYEEKITILRDDISLIGAGIDEVIISWGDYSGDSEGHSTSSSYTVLIEGDGFHAENITFENTAGNVGQAVAVSTTGSQQSFKNCRFLGFQDTYYAKKGMQYLTDCIIEGATDFIFGESTAVFENCKINCVKGGQYITAPADTKLITQFAGSNFYHGLLFLNCDITADGDVGANAYYLGRPWQPNSSSVYVECTLGSHIRPGGWSGWGNDNHLSATFAEYQNADPDGNLVDVSNRVSWSQQLTADQASYYKDLDFYLNGWDPITPIQTPEIASGLQENSGQISQMELSWTAVDAAVGYAVYKNEKFYSFTDTNSYTDPDGKNGDAYQVATVSEYGVISDLSNAIIVDVAEVLGVDLPFEYSLENHKIHVEIPIHFYVYSIKGVKIMEEHGRKLTLDSLKSAVYIIRMVSPNGDTRIAKIAL